MKRYPVPPIAPHIVEQIRRSIAAGRSQEEIFPEMRQLGLYMGHSIKLAHELYGIPLGEAKTAVHYSQTWADCREHMENLHKVATRAALEAGFEEDDPTSALQFADKVLQTSL